MTPLSRRALASYSVDQLVAGQPPARLAHQLAAALIDANKTKEAELLLADIGYELERRGLLAQVTLTSANVLSDSLKRKLTKAVKTAAKVDRVTLKEQIDKSIIGGVKLETASRIWDRTVARQLADIRGGING